MNSKCAVPGSNHSDNLQTVWVGRPVAVTLCGFHASREDILQNLSSYVDGTCEFAADGHKAEGMARSRNGWVNTCRSCAAENNISKTFVG